MALEKSFIERYFSNKYWFTFNFRIFLEMKLRTFLRV